MAIINQTVKQGAILIALAVGVRVLVIAASLQVTGASVEAYSKIHDGAEYRQVAKAMGSRGAMRGLGKETRRLFPGYPVVARVVAFLMPMPRAALFTSVLCAALAGLLFFHVSGDFWLTAYFMVFTPSWLLYSSLAMSEALFLLVALWGVALWRDNRDIGAAVVLGLALLVRPVGALVFLAVWLARLFGTNRRSCAIMAPVFLGPALVWAIVSYVVWGDPFAQFSAYVAKDVQTPFLAIFQGLKSVQGGWDKVILVVFTLLTNFAALVTLFREYVEKKSDEALGLLLWLGLVMAFFVCLPSEWAYMSLDRFAIACLPPMVIGLRWIFPQKWWAVAAVAAVGFGICLYWNHNMLAGGVNPPMLERFL